MRLDLAGARRLDRELRTRQALGVGSNAETARSFFEAAFREDYETCARLIGDTYVLID